MGRGLPEQTVQQDQFASHEAAPSVLDLRMSWDLDTLRTSWLAPDRAGSAPSQLSPLPKLPPPATSHPLPWLSPQP
jgi:hypothetical protein